MNKNHLIASLLFLLLVLAVFLAGCSGSQSSSGTASQAGVSGAATTAASSSPLYQAGDILENPKSGSTSAILILSYDAGTDTYTRAFIYPNSGGSWGYRMDSSTETMDRPTLEKIYTQKITNIPVSQVPIGTPSPTATPVPVTTVPVYTSLPTTVTTATTTSASGAAPMIRSITPYNGFTGTTVSITALTGSNFVSGATVQIVNPGDQSNISASSVSVVSGSTITCTFAIPSNATIGTWDVYVTNPSGYVGKYSNGFIVNQGTSTSTTANTTTSSAGPTITSISPTTATSLQHLEFTVTGTNFVVTPTVMLTNGPLTINDQMVDTTTPTSITVWFTIPSSSDGSWNVVVTNPGGATATLNNAVTISG
jgi:hypothetical protein